MCCLSLPERTCQLASSNTLPYGNKDHEDLNFKSITQVADNSFCLLIWILIYGK